MQFGKNQELFNQFSSTWKKIGAQTPPEDVFLLLATYHQGRTYHGLTHVADCVHELHTTASGVADSPEKLEIALYGHESIYNVVAHAENEIRSAKVISGLLVAAFVARPFVDDVYDLVIVSDHKTPPVTNDQELMVSIDRSILGRSWEVFSSYHKGIKEEYVRFISEETFVNGRISFLEGFLKKKPLFPHPVFEEKYGDQARENMERSLEELRRQSILLSAGPAV